MGALGALIFGGLSSILSWLTASTARKLGVIVAAVAAFVAVAGTMISAIDALIAGIAVAIPSEVTVAASWIIPDNTAACLAAIVTGHLTRWTFDVAVLGIRTKAQAS